MPPVAAAEAFQGPLQQMLEVKKLLNSAARFADTDLKMKKFRLYQRLGAAINAGGSASVLATTLDEAVAAGGGNHMQYGGQLSDDQRTSLIQVSDQLSRAVTQVRTLFKLNGM